MKKPKITSGDWYYDMTMNEVKSKRDHEELLICDIHYYGDDLDEEVANAEAIAQVPKMIDALIKCYGLLRNMPANEEIINACVYAQSALEGAGCTDE